MSLTRPSLLDTVLSDRPPMLWSFSHGEGRDAVGINCKKGATTEHRDSVVKYMG